MTTVQKEKIARRKLSLLQLAQVGRLRAPPSFSGHTLRIRQFVCNAHAGDGGRLTPPTSVRVENPNHHLDLSGRWRRRWPRKDWC